MMQQIQADELASMQAYLGPLLTGEACPVMVRQVPIPFLRLVWPHVVERIARVVERSAGRMTIDNIADRLLRGEEQMWVVYDGAIRAVLTTEIVVWPSGMKTGRINWCTGNGADQWRELVADIHDWSKAQGAVKFEMMARKGWAKLLPDHKISHVLLEKDLTDGQ